MRTSIDKSTTPALFHSDLPGGDMLVRCGRCLSATMTSKETVLLCPCCDRELFYRPFSDW